jgi:hypothetical protein
MGFIRGGLLVIASVLLFILFLANNAFFSLSSSLSYENVQAEINSVVVGVISENTDFSEIIEEKEPEMKTHCENNGEFVFTQEGYTINIPCAIANSGADVIINEAISDIVEDIYYDDYGCDFIDCFKKDFSKPFFLVSETARNFWKSKFYLTLLFSVLLVALIFFLIENKTTLPVLVGGLLIISSLPFLKINLLSSFFGEYLIIFGAVLICLGIALKIFRAGSKMSEFFQKMKKKKS